MFGLVQDSYTYYRAPIILAGNFFDSSDESSLCDESNDESTNFILQKPEFCPFVLFKHGQAFQGHNFWSI